MEGKKITVILKTPKDKKAIEIEEDAEVTVVSNSCKNKF
jgi:hypothetical protein